MSSSDEADDLDDDDKAQVDYKATELRPSYSINLRQFLWGHFLAAFTLVSNIIMATAMFDTESIQFTAFGSIYDTIDSSICWQHEKTMKEIYTATDDSNIYGDLFILVSILNFLLQNWHFYNFSTFDKTRKRHTNVYNIKRNNKEAKRRRKIITKKDEMKNISKNNKNTIDSNPNENDTPEQDVFDIELELKDKEEIYKNDLIQLQSILVSTGAIFVTGLVLFVILLYGSAFWMYNDFVSYQVPFEIKFGSVVNMVCLLILIASSDPEYHYNRNEAEEDENENGKETREHQTCVKRIIKLCSSCNVEASEKARKQEKETAQKEIELRQENEKLELEIETMEAEISKLKEKEKNSDKNEINGKMTQLVAVSHTNLNSNSDTEAEDDIYGTKTNIKTAGITNVVVDSNSNHNYENDNNNNNINNVLLSPDSNNIEKVDANESQSDIVVNTDKLLEKKQELEDKKWDLYFEKSMLEDAEDKEKNEWSDENGIDSNKDEFGSDTEEYDCYEDLGEVCSDTWSSIDCSCRAWKWCCAGLSVCLWYSLVYQALGIAGFALMFTVIFSVMVDNNVDSLSIIGAEIESINDNNIDVSCYYYCTAMDLERRDEESDILYYYAEFSYNDYASVVGNYSNASYLVDNIVCEYSEEAIDTADCWLEFRVVYSGNETQEMTVANVWDNFVYNMSFDENSNDNNGVEVEIVRGECSKVTVESSSSSSSFAENITLCYDSVEFEASWK